MSRLLALAGALFLGMALPPLVTGEGTTSHLFIAAGGALLIVSNLPSWAAPTIRAPINLWHACTCGYTGPAAKHTLTTGEHRYRAELRDDIPLDE